nr:immunoglobulin light chain junction region [Macaca mulatta]
CQQHNSRPLTC